MTEPRAARRAAEKAARERLGGPLISAAGELGVAVAAQQTATDGVSTAEARARKHLQRAQQEAEQMVADARALVATADDGYRQAHQDALGAGWSPAALADMGYDAPAPPRRNRTPPTATDQTTPTQPDLATAQLGPAGPAPGEAAHGEPTHGSGHGAPADAAARVA